MKTTDIGWLPNRVLNRISGIRKILDIAYFNPSIGYAKTGCYQVRQDKVSYQKFGTFVVTCEDAKAYMYRFSTKRRVHKWTDIRVNLYI